MPEQGFFILSGGVLRRAVTVMAAASLPFLPGCRKAEAPKPQPGVPVRVATVAKKTVPVEIRAIGTVQAYATVGVKSRIEGVLQAVHFKEGQDVRKGDPLFNIDPRPFQAALRQAEANLARDTSQLEYAKAEVDRNSGLLAKGIVSQDDYDQLRTAASALEGTVDADKALVEGARLQLSYCSIYAPISGRTGSLILNEGNLVKADADTPMVVVNQIEPIYVSFSIPEEHLLRIRTSSAAGPVPVAALITGEESRPLGGVLSFVDNAVDSATGTIRMKATFTNTDKRLWPGQFVNVVITPATQAGALVIPTKAVESGQKGEFVFVVKSDQTVEARPVTIDREMNEETVVAAGLQEGETVVTEGQLRLGPGSKVEAGNPSPIQK